MTQRFLDFLNILVGLRKTIIMISLIGLCVWFGLIHLMNGQNISDCLKATVIAYFGANGIEHFSGMVKEQLINKRMPTSTSGAAKEAQEVVSGIVSDMGKNGDSNG